MADDPFGVEWDWYNRIVVVLAALPMVTLIVLGPPDVTPTTENLQQVYLWGVLVGASGIIVWRTIVTKFTRESRDPALDER